MWSLLLGGGGEGDSPLGHCSDDGALELAPRVEHPEAVDGDGPVRRGGRAVAPADPGVGQRGLRPDPPLRVHRQHPPYEVLGLLRHRVPLGRVELVGAGLDVAGDGEEGEVSGEEDVHDHPARPHVHRLVVRPLPPELGRHVGRRPRQPVPRPPAASARRRRRGLHRQPEVGDLDRGALADARQEQVLGLEVAVDDALAVCVDRVNLPCWICRIFGFPPLPTNSTNLLCFKCFKNILTTGTNPLLRYHFPQTLPYLHTS